MNFKIPSLSLFFFVVAYATPPPSIGTFSIVARDPSTGEFGVAVQSKLVAVGAVVSFAQANVGAIASQAWGNPSYGPQGLQLLAQGMRPKEVILALTSKDPQRDHRQLAILGKDGNASLHTGNQCFPWAGGTTGLNYAVQGNILTGEEVILAMSTAFEKTTGSLAERMIASLHAGQNAGGDKRGRQSAALLIVREGWGYGGFNDRFRDLRVDDHPKPIQELERIYKVHRSTFPRPDKKLD